MAYLPVYLPTCVHSVTPDFWFHPYLTACAAEQSTIKKTEVEKRIKQEVQPEAASVWHVNYNFISQAQNALQNPYRKDRVFFKLRAECSGVRGVEVENHRWAMVEESRKAFMVTKHKLCNTNLEAQSDMWVMGDAQAQPPNMAPPLSLGDSWPTTQPQKSVGSKEDKDEEIQKPSSTVQ